MTLSDTALVKRVTVAAPPERAFHLFTAEMSAWWPLTTYSITGSAASRVVFPDGIGGDIVEYDDNEPVGSWGTVTDWEPPSYVAFSWHPGNDPSEATRVSVRFHPADGGTEVELTHTGWERRPDGVKARENYDTGWDLVLGRLATHPLAPNPAP